MSKNKHKNLRSWIEGNKDIPSKDVESLWDLSGSYKSSYKPDVEQGLSRLKDRIKNSSEETKVVSMNTNRRVWLQIAAAIALVLAIGFTWKTFVYSPTLNEITQQEQQKEIFLADGTLVTLNGNSSLSYPEDFKGNSRKVMLSGEAYFDVAHNPEKPFVIETKEASVKVLGTSFNLRAYPGESFTEVEVETGKVALNVNQSKNSLILTANEKGVYEHGVKLEKKPAPFTNAQAWRTGELKFKDLALSEVVLLLERRFQVSVKLDDQISDCKFTSNFGKGTTIEEVFASMKRILAVEIKEGSEGEYSIDGNSCK